MDQELDQFKKKIEQVEQEHGSQQAVSYKDLFNPQFMQKNTNFASIAFFVQALGVKDFQDLENVDDAVIDDLVRKETKFTDWQQMQQAAISAYMLQLF